MKIFKKVRKLFVLRDTILYRKKTGVIDAASPKFSADSSLEYVIYNSSRELSVQDLNIFRSILKETTDRRLKWIDRPNYRLFGIKINGELAHFCIVIFCKKGGFFKMADNDDLVIMNCNTVEKHRRKGLYAANLKYICSNWKPDKWAYINTSSVDNIASQKGIEAAGFERIGIYRFLRFSRFNLYVKKIGE